MNERSVGRRPELKTKRRRAKSGMVVGDILTPEGFVVPNLLYFWALTAAMLKYIPDMSEILWGGIHPWSMFPQAVGGGH